MRKGDKRRQDILFSAESLFYLQGYERTTIEDILEKLNCSKGSFYHHFESKMQVLEEIASARIHEGFEEFKRQASTEGLERLNNVLYFASPFSAGDVNFLSVLLSLFLGKEGVDVQDRMDAKRRELYFPVLQGTLFSLREQRQAFWHQDALPLLLWESHMALCHAIVLKACASLKSGDNMPAACLNLLHAARFQWERLLDLPYGSVRMIDAEELVDTLSAAYGRLKHFMPLADRAMQIEMPGLNASVWDQ